MKAIQIVSHDGPAFLRLVDVPIPEAARGEVLIKVQAAGVSFPELLQSRGLYQSQPPLPFIPGNEVAGLVVDAPAGSPFVTGQRVVALVRAGGYAEFATAPPERVFSLPDEVDARTGAALPLNYLTCHFALKQRADLRPTETLLVHGAAGGIGTAAIQVAKALGVDTVIAVVSSTVKAAAARAAGADACILAHEFADHARQLRVDVVLDPVGGDHSVESLRALRPGGRLVIVGFTSGAIPTVKVNRLLLGNLSVVGAGWGSFAFDRQGYAAQQWAEMLPRIESGFFAPPPTTYPLARAASALEDVEQRRVIGKTILEP